MGRFDRPGELGVHLAEAASSWNELLGDLDTGGVEMFGRIDAIARHWAALHREILSPFGISYSELTTLGILRTTRGNPRRSPTELRGLLGQTSAGMTRILDKLEAEGLVRRDPSQDDGRRVDIVLSLRGERLAETAFSELLVIQNELIASLDKRRANTTLSALDTLLAAFAARKD